MRARRTYALPSAEMTLMRWKRLLWLGPVVVVPLLVSCNLLTPLVFVGEHRKKVSPEFDKLANKRVAILVWTEAATLFDYPFARFELATYVGDKLFAEMARRNQDTMVIDPRDVEDFLQKSPGAQIDPRAVGRQFNTDYVVYLEILRFQIQDPQQPQLLQGRVHASVAVYDMHADPFTAERYELAEVICVYPEGTPLLMSATNSPLVREATYQKFAELVARKFYEHTVAL